MIQLPQLQESLLIANERLVDRARRRARRFRLGLMTSAAVVSIGGAAAAGTALWGPILGNQDGNRPTASSTPAPAAQVALVSALRREQTPADRGEAAREALAQAARRFDGIRTADVRLLYQRETSALVLLPVADLGASFVGDGNGQRDALCVFQRVRRGDGGQNCFTTAALRRGEASAALVDLTWGLVPDGVDRVAVHRRDGTTVEVPVRDNVFTTSTDGVDPARPEVEWLDRTGRRVDPEGGRPMVLRGDSTTASVVPEGFHDCGADGGAVPVDVPCGPASRRWVPPSGGRSPITPAP